MSMELARAVVRPIITLMFATLIALMFWTGKEIPQLLQITWVAVLGEWFGERLLLKLLDIKKQ